MTVYFKSILMAFTEEHYMVVLPLTSHVPVSLGNIGFATFTIAETYDNFNCAKRA